MHKLDVGVREVVLPTYISNVTFTYFQSDLDEDAQVVAIRTEATRHTRCSVNSILLCLVPIRTKLPLIGLEF